MSYRSEQRGTVIVVSSAAGGISFGGLLSILFIGLRLGGVIDWPWPWVLAPVWIPGGLVLLVLVSFALLFAAAGFAEARERARRLRASTQAPGPAQHGPAHRWGRR